MSEELKISIEGLYTTFSCYPFRSTMEGCPCCVSDADKEKIHTKQLRKLNSDDLERYAFKAMTTWGDVDDFKHYLPRIFELLATANIQVDYFVILGKLDYGKWTDWSPSEQNVIKQFLMSWWNDLIRNKDRFDHEAFTEIYKHIGDMTLLLNDWQLSFDNYTFQNLIIFIDDYCDDLCSKPIVINEIDDEALHIFFEWVKSKRKIIEDAFFYYENIDMYFAKKISNTIYKIEGQHKE